MAKNGDAALAAAAGIAASKVIEAERRSDEAEILSESIPEGERASKIFRMRFTRAKRNGIGGGLMSNAGDYMLVQGDPNWFETTKQELVAKYGPGDYDGTPCDANKKVLDKVAHWTFKANLDEALAAGWIDVNPAQLPGQPAPVHTKDKVTEARERVTLMQEEIQLESLKQQLAELKSDQGVKKPEADPVLSSKLETLQNQVADATKRAELAKQEAAHKEELARRDGDRVALQHKIDQQARDLADIKHQIANPAKPPTDVGQEVAKALDNSIGKALEKASGWGAILAPVLGALVSRLTAPAPAPPPPPPVPDYIAIITALKNTIQPPTVADPIAMINALTGAVANVRKTLMPEDEGPDEEELLDKELRKLERMKQVMGGDKSTVAEIGDIANRTLESLGRTVVGVASARAGVGPPAPGSQDEERQARKRRALARAKAQQAPGVQVVQDPPVKQVRPVRSQEAQEQEPQATREPTAKEWASLAQGLVVALKKKADPAKVARALARKYPQVAAELAPAPSVTVIELGLISVAGKMGRPYGVFVNELASELRKDTGKAWGEKLLAELKRLASGQGQEDQGQDQDQDQDQEAEVTEAEAVESTQPTTQES